MPAPKYDGTISKEEFEWQWGPETTLDGAVTREELFRDMEEAGWNREGDDKIIAHMTKKRYLEKQDFNAEQFERDITSGKLKDKILKDVVQKQKPEQLKKVVRNPAAGNNHNAQTHL